MMKVVMIGLAAVLTLAPVAWADEDKSDQSDKTQIRTEDLPKPVLELLQKIQKLSKTIEPQIARLGSRVEEEFKLTVKKLCDELKCQEQQESK